MKACILLGNTRVKSNTEALANIFADELATYGVGITRISLRDKNIRPCIGCDKCHGVTDAFGCAVRDDVHGIAAEILEADLLVLASPIHSWMPTPPLKAVMDRMYAFTKYPSGAEPFNLLEGLKVAMIATSGDECEKNCDLFDEAVRRMAGFAGMPYLGYLAARDMGDGDIAKPQVVGDARAFAKKCADALSGKA